MTVPPEASSEALWCEECHRLVEPEEVTEEGACPRCGTELETTPPDQVRRHVPWTFKAMIVASVIYLGYRTYQGVEWLMHHV